MWSGRKGSRFLRQLKGCKSYRYRFHDKGYLRLAKFISGSLQRGFQGNLVRLEQPWGTRGRRGWLQGKVGGEDGKVIKFY